MMSAVFTCDACGKKAESASVNPPKGWSYIWVGDQTGDGPDGVACSKDCAQYKREERAGRLTTSCTARFQSDSENGEHVTCGAFALRANRCPQHLHEELQELAEKIIEFERQIHNARLRQQQLEGK